MDACRPTLSCDFTLSAPAFGLDKANEVFGPPAACASCVSLSQDTDKRPSATQLSIASIPTAHIR